jgi:hypothetical protein
MKKIRDKTIGVMIHTYMEMSQENSLCSSLYLKQKTSFFFFSLFSSTKWEKGGQNRSHAGWWGRYKQEWEGDDREKGWQEKE